MNSQITLKGPESRTIVVQMHGEKYEKLAPSILKKYMKDIADLTKAAFPEGTKILVLPPSVSLFVVPD